MPKRRGRGEGSVEQLPSGSWRAEIELPRRPGEKRQRLGQTFPTKGEAAAWLAERQAEKNKGSLASPGKVTLGEWIDRWLAGRRNQVEPATFRFYEERVTLLKKYVAELQLGKVGVEDVEDMHRRMAADGVTADQQHKAAGCLRAALELAADRGYTRGNPARKVPKPKHRRKKINPLSADEARRFLAAAAGTRLATLWELAIDSGARPGELLALHWRDLNESAGTVHLRQSLEELNGKGYRLKDPKTPKGDRVLRLTARTVASLKAHRERMAEEDKDTAADSIMFPSRTRGPWIGKSNLYRAFRKVLAKAGISRRRPYDLRHTCATLLLSKGVSLRVVADRLGHEDVAITLKFYAHTLPAMEEAAVAALADILSGPPYHDSPTGPPPADGAKS